MSDDLLFFFFVNLFITFSTLDQSKQSVFYVFLWNHKLSKTIGHILWNMKRVYFRKRCFLCSLYQVVAIKVKMFVTRRISRYIIAIWGKLPRMKSIDQSLCLLWLVNTHCSSLFFTRTLSDNFCWKICHILLSNIFVH